MLLVSKLGERPLYLARFPDGSQIQLPQGVHATIELMSRFTDLTGKRIKDIGSVEELAAAVETFCQDLARMYGQAAEALPWALRSLTCQQTEEAGHSPS